MVWPTHEWHEFTLLSISLFFGRYAVLPGLFYWFLWKNPANKWRHKKIQSTYPDISNIFGEIMWSLISLGLFVLVSVLLYFLYHYGYTKIYLDVKDYGWVYFMISILLMIIIHDSYFYWTHRLLHTNFFYHKVHSIHHRFTNPSPWSSFAFHPVEAIIEIGIVILIVFLLPAHPFAISLFLLYMTFMNVMGHSGFEFFPPAYTEHWFWKQHNTSTHHNMHHQDGRYNYGIYFNIWDTIMKTNHPDYRKTFKAISLRDDS